MWSLTTLLCVCFLAISECQDWVIDDEDCRTPDGDTGDCRPIMQCGPITNFMRTARKPFTQQVVALLNSYTCRFESNQVWVCCPPGPISIEDPGGSANKEGPPDVSQHRNYRLLPEQCGYLNLGDRIIGGVNAKLTEFPWMALLSYRTKRGPEFKCGGTIINERYILTAAHCLKDLKSPLLGVRVGEHNIQTKTDCEVNKKTNIRKCNPPIQDLAVEEIIVHPGFNKDVIQNDIGLIRVSGMKLNNANVRPICLPVEAARGADLDKKGVIVTGWGADETGHASVILQQVELTIVSLADCQNIYRSEKRTNITHKQLCAGGKAKKDSCPGDSGGPMQTAAYINDDTRYVQEGVVSFGPAFCGWEGYPGVYTRVDYYMDWLLDVMRP